VTPGVGADAATDGGTGSGSDPVHADPGSAVWKRLRWHACRRGMKELDVLFGRYLEHDWADAPIVERRAFLRLLELPDPELAAYCLQRAAAPDAELAALVARLTDGRHGRVGR
jgi:antitoxin CptB